MKKMITLHTRLHSGIYESQGGGQDRIIKTFTVGPINLLRAITALHEKRVENVVSYGNVGCGASWLEIDGEFFDPEDLENEIRIERLMRKDSSSYSFHTPISIIRLAMEYI